MDERVNEMRGDDAASDVTQDDDPTLMVAIGDLADLSDLTADADNATGTSDDGSTGSDDTTRSFDEDMTGDDEGTSVVIIEETITPVYVIADESSDGDGAGAPASDGTLGRAKAAFQNVGDTLSRAAGSSAGAAKQAGSAVVSTVRSNPVPAALVGVGIGWLIVRGIQANRSGATDSATSTPASTIPASITGATSRLAGQAQQVVKQVTGTAQTLASQAAGKAQSAASQVVSTASQLGSRAAEQALRAGNAGGQLLREQPLAATAVALATGATIGLVIPATKVESNLLSGTRDKLADQAGSAAQAALDKVQSVLPTAS